MFGEHLARQLHRDLRVRLRIEDDETDRAPADAAPAIHVGLQYFERLPLLVPHERVGTGQRQDRVDVVRVGRDSRGPHAQQHRAKDSQSS